MALKQNQRLLYQLPLRHTGGRISFEASETDGASLRNIYAGGVAPKSAVPNGASPGFGIIPAQQSGGMSVYTGIEGASSLSASLALGLGTLATLVGTSDFAATGSQIASLIATLEGSALFTGNVLAALNAAATLAGAGNISGAINGIGYAASLCEGTSTVTLSSYARGFMGATINTQAAETLTAASVAAAVWNGLALEGTYTGAEILRLLASVAAGKTTIQDLGSGLATITFRDVNDTVNRVVADMSNSERTSVTVTPG